jgi:hypothetical protein
MHTAHNARITLLATALNNLALAVVVAGFIAPAASGHHGISRDGVIGRHRRWVGGEFSTPSCLASRTRALRLGAFEKERHVRKLVTIGCAVILLGTASCTTCWTTPVNAMDDRASIRAGSNTVGSGDRAGAPNYYC